MAKAPQKALPKDLVEQAARGHCVALIGPSTDLDVQRATFVETLARDCAYPPDKRDRSLPAVAYYYPGMRDRQQLIARLRDWTDQVEQSPAPLLSSLAASPFTRFVDFAHDARLQFALLGEDTFRLERYRILGGALAQGLPGAVVGACIGVGLALGEWLSRPMADSKSQIADGEWLNG